MHPCRFARFEVLLCLVDGFDWYCVKHRLLVCCAHLIRAEIGW